MISHFRMGRRGFLGGVAALGALGATGAGIGAAAAQGPAVGKLPARGNFVVRGAYVMTMDPGFGDVAGGDVHVQGGKIVAVGKALKAPGATVIDGTGMIVLPGLVETHWHMWNSLLRSMSGDKPQFGYFPTSAKLGAMFTPEDMYQGARLAATEALFSGMTSVHDWCHNIRGPQYADADLRALEETGIRARFSYGTPQGLPPDRTIDLADFERRHREWARYSNGGLISLGLAWRGAMTNLTPVPEEVSRRELDTARRLGLPISVHAGYRHGQIAPLIERKQLGKDVQVIHAILATPDEIHGIAAAGSSVSISPYTELRIGFGFPQVAQLLDAAIPLGLSIDTTALSGDADMFAIMKAAQNVANGQTNDEFKLPARRALELGTIEGARSMGIDDRVGSLKPGKRADLIMVSTREINIGPFTDPAHLLVEAAQPANVDTVVVDGRILKRHGTLTALDPRRIVAEAQTAVAEVRKRANWW